MYEYAFNNPFQLKGRVRAATLAKMQLLLQALRNAATSQADALPTSALNRVVPGAYRYLHRLEAAGVVRSFVKGVSIFVFDEATGQICNGNVAAVLKRNQNELLRQAAAQPLFAKFLNSLGGGSSLAQIAAFHTRDVEPNNAIVEKLEKQGLRDKDYAYGRIEFRFNQRKWWAP